MNNTAKITYLLNSGFVLEINDWAMISIIIKMTTISYQK